MKLVGAECKRKGGWEVEGLRRGNLKGKKRGMCELTGGQVAGRYISALYYTPGCFTWRDKSSTVHLAEAVQRSAPESDAFRLRLKYATIFTVAMMILNNLYAALR